MAFGIGARCTEQDTKMLPFQVGTVESENRMTMDESHDGTAVADKCAYKLKRFRVVLEVCNAVFIGLYD